MSSAFGDVKDQQEAEGVELSENIAEDYVRYHRGNVVGHEEEGMLMYASLLTGWTYDENTHNNVIGIGPPGSGKSLTKNTVENLFDSRDTYTKTSASANAMLDSVDWDLSLVAPMDEYDKIDKPIIEVLKSSNPEDGGYSKDRNVEDKDAKGGYAPVEVSAEANPWVLLYAPSSKKGGIDDELEDRALILYFSNSKHTRRGIGRKEFGHEDIDVVAGGHEDEYIYDTHPLAARLRQHHRELPVRTHYEEDDDGERYLAARSGDTLTYMPPWVWYAVEPIFNIDEDYTNRVYGLVNDAIEGWTLSNYANRTRTDVDVYVDEDETETETREAVVVEPQDVANVLSCMPALLSTTHQLTPIKRHILDAVEKTTPITNEDGTTVQDVRDWLDDNDIPHPQEQTLRKKMDELSENYYLKKWENASQKKGSPNLYELRDEGSLQPPRIYDLQRHADRDGIQLATDDVVDIDPSDPFEGANDPIRDQPFKETVEEFEQRFSGESVEEDTSASSYMGGNSDDSSEAGASNETRSENEGDTQASLSDVSEEGVTEVSEEKTTPLEPDGEPSNPTEQYVFEKIQGADGMPKADSMNVLHLMGIVGSAEREDEVDFTGTAVDPDHELWENRPDLKDDRVINEQDARRELVEAYDNLREKGLVEEDPDNGPSEMKQVRVFDVEEL